MSSANVSAQSQASIPVIPSFWSRESASFRQGIKTGLAGVITYAIYIGWHLPQGYWAVFTALVVIQVTMGASWKPALYRTIGSTVGSVAAIVFMVTLGAGNIRIGVMLFVLGSLFGFLTVKHDSFSAAGFTAAIILVIGKIEGSPFHIGWLRVLYTLLGSAVAFGVGALLWPVRAREVLRQKIANILQGAGTLYHEVTLAALQGVDNEDEVRELDRQLHDLRRGITQQMEEARNELAFSRFNEGAYQQVVELADQVRRRLTAMAEDSSLYVHARVDPELLPSLPRVAEKTERQFAALAEAIGEHSGEIKPAGLDPALRDLDSDLARLRLERATAPFALDRMLPFWALVFNLREVAQDLKGLESALPQLE